MTESMIASSAERLFGENVDKPVLERAEAEGFPGDLWRLVADSGFPLALAPEHAGGIGADWDAAYPILRGIGYWQVPLPLAETMVSALLLAAAGIEVPDGPITLVEQGRANALTVGGSGLAARLTGVARGVPWARDCRWLLVSHAGGALALVDLHEAASARVTRFANCAKIPSDTVELDGARVCAAGACAFPALAEPAWTLGALARCAMMVGALEWILEQSVQYANDRVQFGRPIGRNQAVQQQLALMAGDVAAARVAALVAARDAPSSPSQDSPSARFSVAVAKIRCGEAATRAAAIAHQVHGAIGFTYEHRLHFATRRLWAWRDEFGSDASWAEELGRAAIGAGADGFWPSLTRRRLDAPGG